MQQPVFKERYIAEECEPLFKPAQKMRKHSLCARVLEWESLEFFAVHAAVVLVNNNQNNCTALKLP
jgi:hypothetical protein